MKIIIGVFMCLYFFVFTPATYAYSESDSFVETNIYKNDVVAPRIHGTEKSVLKDSTQSNLSTESYMIKIIYFYPSDYTPDLRYINIINPFVGDVQRWYMQQLGKTFDFVPTQLVKGEKMATEYGSGTDAFYRIYDELNRRIESSTTTIFIVYVPETIHFSCCAVHFGPDYNSTIGNGYAMIDDAVFDPDVLGPITGRCRNGDRLNTTAACSANSRRGGTAHEIGHTLSLPHPGLCDSNSSLSYCYQTVMYDWWDFPNVGLLDTTTAPEKRTLLASPWMWKTSLLPTPSPTQEVTCQRKTQGDANCDNIINPVDFNIWKREYEARVGISADFNNDMHVDAVDFNIWKRNFEAKS